MAVMKRTPMKPRVTPMPRGSKPTGSSGATAGRIPAAFAAPKRRPVRRETGFPYRVKLAIRARAGESDAGEACCECCGAWLGLYGGQVQHRSARMAGGTRNPVMSSTANGVLLCGDAFTGCHGAAESRDGQMLHDGFWLEHGNGPEFDPRFASILWHSRAGSGVQLWLGTGGGYLFAQPEPAAA